MSLKPFVAPAWNRKKRIWVYAEPWRVIGMKSLVIEGKVYPVKVIESAWERARRMEENLESRQ